MLVAAVLAVAAPDPPEKQPGTRQAYTEFVNECRKAMLRNASALRTRHGGRLNSTDLLRFGVCSAS